MLDLGFESFQLLFHGADFVRKLFSPPATQRQDKNSSGHVKLTEESNQAGQTTGTIPERDARGTAWNVWKLRLDLGEARLVLA